MNWTIIVLAWLGLLLIAGTPATAWTADITLSSEGRTDVLTFGLEEGASDDFDSGMDIPLPPPPPSSPFSAYLVGNGLFEMLQTDIRTTHSWNIYTVSEGDINVAWDAAPIPLTITLGEDRFSLTESGHQTLSPGEYGISIQAVQSLSSSKPSGSAGGSLSPGSTVSETLSVAVPTPSPVSTTTPDRIQENMPLSPTTAVTDTSAPVSSMPEVIPTPGFGAVLTLLGVSVLMLTLSNRKMK